MRKISGDVLLGFSDFFNADAVGAKATPPAKGAPPKKVIAYPKAKHNPTVQTHGKVLSQAHNVASKAAMTLAKAQHLLSASPKRKSVHVGAAAPALSPKAKLAVQKHNAAVAKANQAAKVLAQHMVRTNAAVRDLSKKMVTQKKTAVSLRKPARKGVHVGHLLADPVIGEDVAALLGEYYTAVGADPDPNKPGFLTDGSPDPAYASTDGGAGTGTDTGTGDAGAGAGASTGLGDPSLDPTGQDSGATLGPPPDMSTFIADMTQVGGIAYNGAKGTPDGYVGSYGLMTRKTDQYKEPDTVAIDGTEHHGYVWGNYDWKSPAKGIPWGDALGSNQWNLIDGRYHLGDHGKTHPVDAAEAFQSNTQQAYGVPFGPLVGNPAMPDFAHMRVDAQGNMFWLPQEAPDWLTFPLKQAAALTAQAAAKAAKDAAAADAAAQAKAAADAQAAQAAQDAQNALAESQATSAAKVAQAQAQGQQADVETQAQQQVVQQAQADLAQQQAESEQAQQAGALILAQAKRQEEYLAAHPEVEYGPPPEGGDEEAPPEEGAADGGDEGGGDEGGGDEGGGGDEAAPEEGMVGWGDVMDDLDGEGAGWVWENEW